MVSGINKIEQSFLQPEIAQKQSNSPTKFEPMDSFYQEDEAIISSEAKLQYELEKFNSGGDNAVDLALANVTAKTTVNAEVNVINTKKNMLDVLLGMAD